MDKFLQLPDDMNAICDIYRDEICYYYYILQIYRNKPIVKNEDIQHLENPLGKSVKKVLDIVKGGGDLSSLIEPTLDRWGNYYSNISEFYFLLEESQHTTKKRKSLLKQWHNNNFSHEPPLCQTLTDSVKY